jgi:NTP pyrophosphatase (non-canonical NTP hydrolase)
VGSSPTPRFFNMDIKEMQEAFWKVCNDYNSKHGIKHDPSTSLHHLVEEVGELAREIAKENNDWRKEGFDKKKIADEINDVICQCFLLATDYDVNLEEAFERKIKEWRERWKLDD